MPLKYQQRLPQEASANKLSVDQTTQDPIYTTTKIKAVITNEINNWARTDTFNEKKVELNEDTFNT